MSKKSRHQIKNMSSGDLASRDKTFDELLARASRAQIIFAVVALSSIAFLVGLAGWTFWSH